jgi:hypothetical protein
MYVKHYYCVELNNFAYVKFAGNINKVSHRGQKFILITVYILQIFAMLLLATVGN